MKTESQVQQKSQGMTIIQLMVVLLFAGLIGSVVVRLIIDKRCETNPSAELCVKHSQGK